MSNINLKLSIQNTNIKAKVEERLAYDKTMADTLEDVKQALIEKGVATEETSNSELSEAIANISSLKALLDVKKSTNGLFNGVNIESVDHLIKYDDTENVENMSSMFGNIEYLNNLPMLNTSKVTNMSKMCGAGSNNYKITEIPLYDTSNVTNMSEAFANLKALKKVPLFNTSKVTNMQCLFIRNISNPSSLDDCANLEELPLFDTSNVTNMSNMCKRLVALKELPLFDTSNVTNMSSAFESCSAITTLPKFNTSKVTNMSSMCRYATSLKEVPELDTSKVTGISYIFDGAKQLEKIGGLNLKSISSSSNMNSIVNSPVLTNVKITNIPYSLKIRSGTSYGHLVVVDDLINLCKECIKDQYNIQYTLTLGSANLEKIANVYVKFTDPAQTTISRGEKGDVVVCESTDEGAMLISEYMGLKNWQLA